MKEEIQKAKEAGDVESLKHMAVTAEAGMEWDEVSAIEAAIKEIESAATATETSTNETKQIEEQGGNLNEITNRTNEVDEKIEALKTETEEQIKEVKPETPDLLVSEDGKDISATATPENTEKPNFDALDGAQENGEPIPEVKNQNEKKF